MKSDFHYFYGWVRKISYCFQRNRQSPCQFLAPWFSWTRTFFWVWDGCDASWFTGSILSNALPDTMCIVPQVLVGTWVIRSERTLLQPPKGGLPCVGSPLLAHVEALWGGLSLAEHLIFVQPQLLVESINTTPPRLLDSGNISTSQYFVFLCSFECYYHHHHHPPTPTATTT